MGKNPYKAGKTLLKSLLVFFGKLLLSLRYKIKIKGMENIYQKGNKKIIFLPNHIALNDPIILCGYLYKYFQPRTIADEFNISNPIFNWISNKFGVRAIPDVTTSGVSAKEKVKEVFEETIEGLNQGENLLIYPSGRLKRQHEEVIGATTGAANIIHSVEGIRVVLIRHNGLWGSSLTWAYGKRPDLLKVMLSGIKKILLNLFFFTPRRVVEIEFYEPEDFPYKEDHLTMNAYMEKYFNEKNDPNTYVPYYFWEKGKTRVVPEPEKQEIEGDLSKISKTTKEIVISYLKELTGEKEIREDQKLSYDLGLDSISIAEVLAWLESEFGFPQCDTDAYKTVGDVMLGAVGQGVSTSQLVMNPVGKKWFKKIKKERVQMPDGENIAEVFLKTARKHPNKVVIADQSSGEKTYRDMVTAIMVLKKHIEKLEGDKVGIMFPASVGATLFYYAVLFSGKTPVMVNWTTGIKNIVYCMEKVGVKYIITAKKLILKLQGQGLNFKELEDRFIFAETLGASISLGAKLQAALKAKVSWRELDKVEIQEPAVILFTSGSESFPKSVPLSHQNIMKNLRDILSVFTINSDDTILGILPPFHSFGLSVTTIMSVCASTRCVYHSNPTEAQIISRILHEYKVSIFLSTPTFLQGVIRVANKEQLVTLRAVVTGAEKCSESLFRATQEMCEQVKIVEGYGLTECSPVVSLNDEDEPVLGTIGKILPSIEYVLVNPETNEKVEQGTSGMLLLRGPNIFEGYIKHDGSSPFVEFDGKMWYKSGDIVVEDKNGVLTFCGRLKRFIKLGGEMISLPAIENVLIKSIVPEGAEGPQIAVEATKDESNPEIVLFTTFDIDRSEVNKHIRDAGLSALHNIRQILKVEEIPLLGTGKTNYRALKEQL